MTTKYETATLCDLSLIKEVPPLPEVATKKELRAWYLYDFANGAWFYVAMNFLPLLITSQASNIAIKQYIDVHCTSDCENYKGWAKDYENDGICDVAKYTTATACEANDLSWTAEFNDDAKTFSWCGISLGVASIAQYCTTISVILQLILFITMGSMADYGGNRKFMFMTTNSIGILAAFLVLFMADDNLFWVNGLLYIIGVVAFHFAYIFYNAYLPVLIGSLPDVIAAKEENRPEYEIIELVKKYIHLHSLKGLSFGFCGQLLILCLCLPILSSSSTSNLGARLTMLAVALWLLIFTSITFYYLKQRPGPPLPRNQSYFKHSATQILQTFKSFKQLRQLGLFLIAYFVFSDGTSTIATSAAIFAHEELNMSMSQILLGLIEVSIFAVAGCYFFKWIHERFRVSAKYILILNLCLMGILPIYSLFFMTQVWEFYFLIFFFGINTGSQQAFTRSIFAHNLPCGREAEYFSFYEITDKGTAWLGPLTVALVNQATGSYRSAFSTLVIFFVLGITILLFFDPAEAEVQKLQFDVQCEKSYADEKDQLIKKKVQRPSLYHTKSFKTF